MEETIKIQIDLPSDFSFALDRKLQELKETGVRKSKAQYIIELAQLALYQKTIKK
jgi:hypothetical protein